MSSQLKGAQLILKYLQGLYDIHAGFEVIDMSVLKWRVSLLTFVRDLCDCFTLTLYGPTSACQYEELEVPFYR